MRDNGQLETAYLMLVPGKHLCLKVQEPESIPTRYSQTVYHGTSLGALEKIMGEGFRPSLGAGSDEAGKKYGCSLPMVYTSGLLETAHGYVGNVDNGQRIGSGQNLGPKVNCVVWMKADPEGRLFRKKPVKNKSGQLRNEQQGYHPKDLTVTRIYLHCLEAGLISPQKAKYGDNEPSRKDRVRLNADLRAAAALLFDEEQAPWWKPPPKVIQQKKEGGTAGLSKANRRVLQRWRKQRRGEQPASGSGSAPPPPPPPGVTSKSAPCSGREHEAHLEEAVERLAAMEKDERVRLELESLKALAPPPPRIPPPAVAAAVIAVGASEAPAEKPAGPHLAEGLDYAAWRAEAEARDFSPVGRRTGAARLEMKSLKALAPPPPRFPPPAAQGPQRSRSPRQRRGDTRRLCVNGCGRAAATGFAGCCRTCNASGGTSHGPRCNAAWQQVNEPPSPVLEPTSRDAPATPAAGASRDAPINEPSPPVLGPTTWDAASRDTPMLVLTSAAPSRDAPMRDHIFCAYCHQRRGDQRCIRCHLHPLCQNCLPMHWCNQSPQEGTSAAQGQQGPRSHRG